MSAAAAGGQQPREAAHQDVEPPRKKRGRPSMQYGRTKIGTMPVAGPKGLDAQRVYRTYDAATMQRAADAYRAHISETSLEKVAADHDVPKSSLLRYIQQNRQQFPPLGAPTALTADQEVTLEKWAMERSDLDMCVHELAIREKAARLAGREDGCMSTQWLYLFLQRHNVLSKRKGEMVSDERRGSFTDEALKDMSMKAMKICKEKSIVRPDQIFAMDEKGTHIGKSTGKVIASSASSAAPMKQGPGEHGKHVTICVGTCADGQLLHAFFIFKRVYQFPAKTLQKMVEYAPNARFAHNASGGSDEESMIQYLLEIILPVANRTRKDDEWSLFIIDQFWYHCSLKFLETCSENRVVVLGGVPHGSHKYQIADTHLNAPLAKGLGTETMTYYSKTEKPMDVWEWLQIADRVYNRVLSKQLVLKAHSDNGWTIPLDPYTAMKDRVVGANTSKKASVGLTSSRSLRERDKSTDLPNILTAEWALDPSTRIPLKPLDTWSREEIWDCLRASTIMNHRDMSQRV